MERPANALYQPYAGPIHWDVTDKKVRLAMQSYYGQCHRSKISGLPKPEYNTRDFISWWLAELELFNGKTPTCGRIDHSRGYSWSNICLQDHGENSRECAIRHKKGTKENKVKNEKPLTANAKDGSKSLSFKSRTDAASYFSVPISSIVAAIARGPRGPIRKDSALSSFVFRGEL